MRFASRTGTTTGTVSTNNGSSRRSRLEEFWQRHGFNQVAPGAVHRFLPGSQRGARGPALPMATQQGVTAPSTGALGAATATSTTSAASSYDGTHVAPYAVAFHSSSSSTTRAVVSVGPIGRGARQTQLLQCGAQIHKRRVQESISTSYTTTTTIIMRWWTHWRCRRRLASYYTTTTMTTARRCER